MRTLILVVLFLLGVHAHASPVLLTTAFEEGNYRDAASDAIAMGSADGLAFAARCNLAEAMSDPTFTPPEPLILEAERLARESLALDPRHVEGRLQLAIALSLRARPLSTRAAMRSGFGDEAKALAEAVLVDDPNNYYAHGFMAVWHIEVVRRGGSVGSAIMGASVRRARNHYQAAIQANPSDVSTHWQYARALTALNAKKYRKEIDAALGAAIGQKPPTALDTVMQNRAKTLKSALNSEPRRTVQATAADML
ncbi:MAG: hypothetical protein AAF296_08535 [Pseudomonadota bacterium]